MNNDSLCFKSNKLSEKWDVKRGEQHMGLIGLKDEKEIYTKIFEVKHCLAMR